MQYKRYLAVSKMLRKEKRGYFFILDAVLGLFVLVIGVFLVTYSYVAAPNPSQVGALSEDLLNFLSTKKIKELNDPYVGVGGSLWTAWGITPNIDNSLLQQIGEFYATNKLDMAEQFIQHVSSEAVPPQFRYEVWMNNVILYPKIPSPEHTKSKSDTAILLTSKKVTFGIDKTTNEMWGPYKAEVYVWER